MVLHRERRNSCLLKELADAQRDRKKCLLCCCCCCFVLFKSTSPFLREVMSYLYRSEDCGNEWVSLIWRESLLCWFEVPSLKPKELWVLRDLLYFHNQFCVKEVSFTSYILLMVLVYFRPFLSHLPLPKSTRETVDVLYFGWMVKDFRWSHKRGPFSQCLWLNCT